MAGEDTPSIKGAQLWLPSDSFSQEYNIARVGELMADFQTLSILHKPGEDPIYCGGNGVIYHTVQADAVQRRLQELRFQPTAVTSCLQPNQAVDKPALAEEARVRELHLGLGRTAMFLAANAERDTEFMQAVDDIKEVFLMLNQRVHSLDALTKTSAHSSGLIYMLVKAARKHKTLSREAAIDLADALDSGILPVRVRSFQEDSEAPRSWRQVMGGSFVVRVSFAQDKPEHLKDRKPRKISKTPRAQRSYKLHQEKPAPERKVAPKKSKAEIFIHRLTDDKRHVPYSVKLASAHERFLGENAETLPVRNNTKLGTARLGVGAYLESMMLGGNDSAGQILAYFSRKKGNYRNLIPLIVAGNLLTAKVNANGGHDGKELALPGIHPKGVSEGFRAVRIALNMSRFAKEDEDNKRLGNIVEAYLQAAFTQADAEFQEVIPAPEGVIPIGDFSISHNIGQLALDTILAEHGIDLYHYKFGSHVRRGLTADDQELLETVIEETRPPQAPKGTVSVSTFCIVRHLAKVHVDELIKEHNIETGVHMFKSRRGRSLSPEAQKRLDDLLYE